MKNKNYTTIIFIFILLAFILINTNITLLNKPLSIGLILYSVTYYITYIIIEKINIKEYKNILKQVIKYILIFYTIITIINFLNITPKESIINIFTPNYIIINNYNIYYPNILNLILYLLTFYFTHYIFYIIYEVTKPESNYIIAFIISILISFILDQILYTTTSNIYIIINNIDKYKDFLTTLTSNLMVTLLTTIILTPLTMVNKKTKKLNN